jgi:signal transduction histidine kinase
VGREPQNQLQPDLKRLQGRARVLALSVYILLTMLTLALVAIQAPMSFQRLQTVCTATTCRPEQLTTEHVRALAQLDLSPSFFATYALACALCFVLVSVVVSFLLVWHASDVPIVLFVACVLLTIGAASIPAIRDTLLSSSSSVRELARVVIFLGRVSPVLLFFVFPDGRFVPRWMALCAAVMVVLAVNAYFFRDALLGPWLATPTGNLLAVGFIVLAVGGQVYRYRRVSSLVQRQQTKWVVWGFVLAMLVSQGTQLVLPYLEQPAVLVIMLAYALEYGSLLLIPLSIGAALLRSRLWDIDPVINRTLMYGVLTASVVGLYILFVGSLSLLFQSRGNLILSLLATGLIAVLVQPLRMWVQRGVNHLLYGERDEPYAVLARLGQRLEATLAPAAVLPTIVETVRETLKLPYVAVVIDQDGMCLTAAASGTLVPETLTLPLVHQGEPIGQLILGQRAPGEPFTRADRALLGDLARQAGIAAHAIRLTAELQRSRERLVLAREEERRRLRNDLHDGVAPTLATLALAASNVVDAIPTNPSAAVALARELEQEIRNTVGDVRRIVYGLRPPALDELGLVAAIRESVRPYTRQRPSERERLRVQVEAPDDLPSLPAAVEVAAYRITQEAVQNAVKHAQARVCTVRLALTDMLLVEIVDDGIGLSPEHTAGVGLQSMRERAAELGGQCVVEVLAGGGTRVRAWIPVGTE